MSPDQLALLAWCEDRLWRPEEYLGDEGREERERVLYALAERRENEEPPPDYSAQEFRPGYLSKLRRKIEGKTEEPLRPVVRMDRAVGERR